MFSALKAAASEFAFSFRPTQQCANLGFVLKMTSFKDTVDSFLGETITLYRVYFQIQNLAEYFPSLRAALHCMNGNFQKLITGEL